MYQLPLIGPPLGLPYTINRASSQAKGLILWFPTIGQKTGKLVDYHTGVFTGGTWSGDTKIIADGVLGQVLDFDGSGDRITYSHDSRLSPTNKTISAWVRFDSVSGTRTLVKKDGDYILRIDGGNFQFFVWSGGAQQAAFSSPSTGIYYLVTGTWDGTTIRLYINGIQRATATPGGGTGTSSNPFTLGAQNGGGEELDGVLGDVRVYDRCLSPNEVWNLYNPQTRYELYRLLAPLSVPYYAPPSATIIDPGTVSTPFPYILRDRAPLRATYTAQLFTPQGQPQAIITGYSQLSYTLTTSSDGGGFSIALPPTMDRSWVKEGSFVTITRKLDGGIPHFEDCYIVLSTPEAQAKKGTRFPTIEGPSVTGYLMGKDFRAVGQLDSTLGSFVTSTPADNAVRYFVSRNMAAGAENNTFGDVLDRRGRDISKLIGFTVEKDRSLGPNVTYNASLKSLDVVIRDIAKLCEEDKINPARLFWYVKPKSFNPLTFEFVVFLGKLPSAARPKVVRGAFNTYRGFDSAAPVILGPAFGTVIETDQERDLRESYNSILYTYNTKTAIGRITDRARAGEFPLAHREKLVDAADSGTEAEGAAEVRGELNDGRPRLITRFTVVDSLATAYGRDYFMGDILGCMALDRRFEAEVSGVEVNYTRDSETKTIKVEEIPPFTV